MLHNEELYDLYCSPHVLRVIKSRRKKWAGHVARRRGEKRCMHVFFENPLERDYSGRSRRRWEYNIHLDLLEGGCGDMDWIHVAQDKDR